MTEASVFATPAFLEAIGSFKGKKTTKEGVAYFIETGTKNKVPCRFSIPTTVQKKNGKFERKFLGTFGKITTLLAWTNEHCNATEFAGVKTAVCAYYSQPEDTTKAGPSILSLSVDQPDSYEDDIAVPGVILAEEYVGGRKRKASAPQKKTKPKKAPKIKKPKDPVQVRLPKGYYKISTNKNMSSAIHGIALGVQVISETSRFGDNPYELTVGEEATLTYDASADKPNPWCIVDGTKLAGIKGNYVLRCNKPIVLGFSSE